MKSLKFLEVAGAFAEMIGEEVGDDILAEVYLAVQKEYIKIMSVRMVSKKF